MTNLFDLGADVSWLIRLIERSSRVVWWCLTTMAEGAAVLYRIARLVPRLPRLLADELPCPRGHLVRLYGVYECTSCRAPHEGYVFDRCAICGLGAGWTPCPECGLPVVNPRMGRA